MDFDWFWVGSGEPVLVASLGTLEGPASFAPATSPEMFSGSLDSVCFNRGNEHDFVKMRVSRVCKKRLGTWNTARLAASSPSQNWTT